MQEVHPNLESISGVATRGGDGSSMIVRTDLSSLLSDYTTSQRRYNDRLQSLEREMVSLKGKMDDALTSSTEPDLNQTFTTKKLPSPLQPSPRAKSLSRIPLPITPRKLSYDSTSAVSNPHASSSNVLPPMPLARSKTFHSDSMDETGRRRPQKSSREQARPEGSAVHADIRVPNYSSVEDVISANEELLFENDRLRTEQGRLKAENLRLRRSRRNTTTAGNDTNSDNERVLLERERQELNMELARQVEENKRLRKALLAQSAKFLTLRQATPSSTSTERHHSSQSSLNSSRRAKSKSARCNSNHRGLDRGNTSMNGSSRFS